MPFETDQPSYRAFRDIVAERTRRVTVWVGAGLSRPAGLPSWPELRADLTNEARKQANARPEHSHRDMAEIAAIERIESHWTAFERLREVLGEPTFVSQIRRALSKADGAIIPENYRRLWGLPLWAMITLNLDRFAARAFGDLNPGRALSEIDAGSATGQYGTVLQTNTPIIVNAHGVLSNRDSWVFTKTEIDALLEKPAYVTFLESIIATSSVLFIGMSADDVASGGFVERMLRKGFSTGEHFWLTHRGDDGTRAWANGAGIQPIYYAAADGHDRALAAFFEDLERFRSRDSAPPPVRHAGPALVPTAVTEAESPNAIRRGLAALVDAALEQPDPIGAIHRIASERELALHKAWFVSFKEPNNEFFDYKLERKLGEGGFGRVYLGTDPKGKPVAVKVLRQEILDSDDLLGSFRRGVRSMRILSDRNVEGMVPYLDAYELPPSVVMDYVDGPNLQELKQRGDLSSLDAILAVAARVARIVHSGHMLPERVLHRDIRPANIMIRDYYHSGSLDEVVVLDFDLSWHKGSDERSIELGAVATMGYLAPELTSRSANVSTRSTAVDVFGLAMTVYFMLSGAHPQVGIVFSSDWERRVKSSVDQFATSVTWRSLLRRLTRLLLSCTRPNQHERPDMPSMLTELERLRSALAGGDALRSAELVAEEIAARAGGWSDYSWDHDSLACSFRLASGVAMRIVPDEVEGLVRLSLTYVETGQTERRGVQRYVSERRAEVVDRLRSAGWEQVVQQSDTGSLGVEAVASASAITAKLDSFAGSLSSILRRLGMA